MENIIIILGPKTEDIRLELDVHYASSVTVIGSYNTPEDFHREYYKKTMRVDRIIVAEGAISHNPYDELTKMKEVLETFFAEFKEVFFLVQKDSPSIELLEMLKTDLGARGDLLRVFDNKTYNGRMVINYCLGSIMRKHFVEQGTEFQEVVRERINGTTTFEIEDEKVEEEETDIVIIESSKSTSKEFQMKKNNLLSTAQSHRDLSWEISPLIKDITKLNELNTLAENSKRYEIDYSDFYLKDKVKKELENVMIVTGEERSGKSSNALALAKSFSATGKRVLLIETDLKSLGLSDLIERSGLPVSAMLMQDFLDFKNAIRTIANTQRRINAIVANSETFKALSEINHLSLINMLTICAKKYFDLVIIDISLEDTEECRALLHMAKKVVIATPNKVSSIVSTYKAISELDSLNTVREKYLFIPNRMFNQIQGVIPDTNIEIKTVIKALFGEDSRIISALKIVGFELDESLFRSINAK